MADEPQEPPVGVEPQEPPVADEPQEPPVGVEPQEPPVADEPQEPPAAEEPQEPPGADEPQEPPVEDAGVPEVPLKHRLMNEHCTKVSTERWRTLVYELNLREVPTPNSSFNVYEFGVNNYVDNKVIMVVGATGAGKTTLLNSLINYVFGVKMEDNFRFQLVPQDPTSHQSESQTTCVNCYTLYHQEGFNIPYTLTIIDTPGFGDTRGIKRDQEIFRQIGEFFTYEPSVVQSIDAVGFVVASTQSRLDQTQRYIFDAIMSLFGKDINDNISLMFTFCDLKDPQVLPSIREANIPFGKYFKFNNSAIFVDEPEAGDTGSENEENPFTDLFWKLGMKSFKKFTETLDKLEARTPALTREVLQRRQAINDSKEKLYQALERCIARQKELELERGIREVQQTSARTYESSSNKQTNMADSDEDEIGWKASLCGILYWCRWFLCRCGCGFTWPKKEVSERTPLLIMLMACLCGIPYCCAWFLCCCGCCCTWPKKEVSERTPLLDDSKVGAHAKSDSFSSEQKATHKATTEDIQKEMMQELETIQENTARLRDIAMKPDARSAADFIDIMIADIKFESKRDWELGIQELQAVKSKLAAKPRS